MEFLALILTYIYELFFSIDGFESLITSSFDVSLWVLSMPMDPIEG